MDINNLLGELKTFRKIAAYNIINRSLKVLKDDERIDASKIIAYPDASSISIFYQSENNQKVNILRANLSDNTGKYGRSNAPYFNFYETDSNTKLYKRT